MPIIIPNIQSLVQHIYQLNVQPEDYRPHHCPTCGRNKLWNHGAYIRKSNRRSLAFETDEPILIPRFLCPLCKITCSTLPEAIPPRRHYLWALQQAILLQLLSGVSLKQVAKQWPPSSNTIRRWWHHLKAQLKTHSFYLCSIFSQLGRAVGFDEFWSSCFAKMELSRAMYHVNSMGSPVP